MQLGGRAMFLHFRQMTFLMRFVSSDPSVRRGAYKLFVPLVPTLVPPLKRLHILFTSFACPIDVNLRGGLY